MAAIIVFVFVFVEKLLPAGQWIARGSGIAMLGFGIYLRLAGLNIKKGGVHGDSVAAFRRLF